MSAETVSGDCCCDYLRIISEEEEKEVLSSNSVDFLFKGFTSWLSDNLFSLVYG